MPRAISLSMDMYMANHATPESDILLPLARADVHSDGRRAELTTSYWRHNTMIKEPRPSKTLDLSGA